MPWNYSGGAFQFVSGPTRSAPRTFATTTATPVIRVSGEPDMTVGSWVEHTGVPDTTIGTFKHYNVSVAHSHLQLAEEHSRLVAGIVISGTANYVLQRSGVALAWLLQPLKTTLPLSGVYTKSINGVASGQVVITHNPRDNSFMMAESKDSELQYLKLQFANLTNS